MGSCGLVFVCVFTECRERILLVLLLYMSSFYFTIKKWLFASSNLQIQTLDYRAVTVFDPHLIKTLFHEMTARKLNFTVGRVLCFDVSAVSDS